MASFSHPAGPASVQRWRILIADDHPIVRAAVRRLLETEPTLEVVGEASDGQDALAKIAELLPHVALVDVAMPKLDGIEVARRVATASYGTRVLALTAFEDGRHVQASLAAGAAGFVPKSAAAAHLITAIHAVAQGEHYVHPRVAGGLVNLSLGARRVEIVELSARESEVLRLIALGFTNKEISSQLSVSVKTVETYKARAMEKIGATSRVDIVQFAIQRGWLSGKGLA